MIYVSENLYDKEWITFDDLLLSEIEGLIKSIDVYKAKADNFMLACDYVEGFFIKDPFSDGELKSAEWYCGKKFILDRYFYKHRY